MNNNIKTKLVSITINRKDRETAAHTHGATEYNNNNIIAQTNEETLSPIESVHVGLAQNLTSNMTWLKKT